MGNGESLGRRIIVSSFKAFTVSDCSRFGVAIYVYLEIMVKNYELLLFLAA